MKPPSEFEVKQLFHIAAGYDPVKAHEYYEKHKKLKGRRKGQAQDISSESHDPRTGKTREQIAKEAKAKQRKELTAAIHKMEGNLKKLETLIKERIHEEKSEDRKSKAKKERAAKEREKPKTAAEKAKAARENEKYRDKHQQKLKSDSKKDGASGGSSSKHKGSKKHSIDELKSLATRVRGQIAIAKQKLAAL